MGQCSRCQAFPSPSGKGGPSIEGAPGEGRKPSQVLGPSPHPLPEGERVPLLYNRLMLSWIEIDKARLTANINALRALQPGDRIDGCHQGECVRAWQIGRASCRERV